MFDPSVIGAGAVGAYQAQMARQYRPGPPSGPTGGGDGVLGCFVVIGLIILAITIFSG